MIFDYVDTQNSVFRKSKVCLLYSTRHRYNRLNL